MLKNFFQKKIDHVGNKIWMWLPLSLIVFISYVFQRGIVAISKTTLGPASLNEVIPIFMITVAVASLIVGILCDKFNTRTLFAIECFIGFCGLLLIEYHPIAFAILFGSSVAMNRIGSCSTAMKVWETKLPIRVLGQAVAKSIATIVLPVFMSLFLLKLGWSLSISIMAGIYLLIGYSVYRILPYDRLDKWNIKGLWEILKSSKWYAFLILCPNFYLLFTSKMIPSLINIGWTRSEAVGLLSMLIFGEIIGRFFWAWVLTKKENWYIGVATMANVTDLFLFFLLPFAPIIAIFIHFFANSGGTVSWWPAARTIVGPQYVATVYGIGICITFIIASIFF